MKDLSVLWDKVHQLNETFEFDTTISSEELKQRLSYVLEKESEKVGKQVR